MTVFYLIFFAIPFILEAIGSKNIFPNLWIYYLLLPTFLYLYLTYKKREKITVPLKTSLAYGIFLFFSLFSSLFFSFDKQQSFETWLYYLSLFLIYIFFYNERLPEIFMEKLLIIVSLFLTGYSLALNYGLQPIIKSLIPTTAYQLVYPSYGHHNHLGDILGLAAIILLNSIKKRKIVLLPLLVIILLVMILSNSLSAIIALALSSAILLLKKRFSSVLNKRMILAGFISFLLSLILFISTVYIYSSKKNLNFSTSYNILSSGRVSYAQQGISSFIDKPFFGVGLNNFRYASRRWTLDYGLITNNAHNLLIDMLAETGLFASIGFIFFLFINIAKIKNNILHLPIIYLLLNFQFDYTYKIYGILAVFFTLLSLGYFKEKKREINTNTVTYGGLALLPLFFLFIYFTSQLFLKTGDNEMAIRFYPLNKDALANRISANFEAGDMVKTQESINSYLSVFPADENMLLFAADISHKKNDDLISENYYDIIYKNNKFVDFSVIKEIYNLKRKRSPNAAYQFISDVLSHYGTIYPPIVSSAFLDDVYDFCEKEKIAECYHIYWIYNKKFKNTWFY